MIPKMILGSMQLHSLLAIHQLSQAEASGPLLRAALGKVGERLESRDDFLLKTPRIQSEIDTYI